MRFLVFIAGMFLLSANCRSQDDPLASLEAAMEKELSTVDDPIWKMQSSYVKALKNLEKDTIESGDLDNVLMVRKEIAEYREKGQRDYSSFAGLANLRGIYESSLSARQAEVHKDRAAIYHKYAGKFAEVTKELTIAGNLELAVKANSRQKALLEDAKLAMKAAAEGAGVSASSGQKVLWELKGKDDIEFIKGCEIESIDGGWLVTSPEKVWSQVASNRTFTPPFEIDSRISTDSTNIRIYLGGRVISIFNWEVNKKQLRIHDPATGKRYAFDDQGYLKENEMHDIRIVVGTRKLSVYSDGELRGEIEGDYSELETPVGIGPAFFSKLKIERFLVREVKEE